ncbi:MAG: GAF domain-containing sensor histidine kinase [Bdellovibrionota bacterium]
MNSEFYNELGPVTREINRELLTTIPYSEILDHVFSRLEPLIPFDRIGIALVAGQRLQSFWSKSKLPIRHLPLKYSAPLAGSSLESVLKSGRPRIINDLETYLEKHPSSDSTQRILADGIRSNLTCPLYFDGASGGVVFFSSKNPGTYLERHIEAFEYIADHLALIILKGKSKSRELTLSTILHDLKSPLGVMQGFLSLLDEEDRFKQLAPPSQNIVQVLTRNCSGMLKLVDDLKNVEKIMRGEFSLKLEEMELTAFLESLVADIKLLASKKEIDLQTHFDSALPIRAFIDPLRVTQILENLLSNAIKYSWPKSVVHLEVTAEPTRIIFKVKDQGPGIAEAEQDKLFHEFGKTSTRPTAGEESTGLGLYICRQLVEQHGGEISVQSALDKGSTFTFWLPLERV